MKKTVVLLLVALLLCSMTSAFAATYNIEEDFFVENGHLHLKDTYTFLHWIGPDLSAMTREELIATYGQDFTEVFAYYRITPPWLALPEFGDDSLPTGLLVGAAALTLCGAIIARKKRLSAV